MNIAEFQKSSSHPDPVYLLLADQPYFRRMVYEHCRNQVPESARAFDWSVLDLEEETVNDLIRVARTLPWMGPRRWVYAKNGQAVDPKLLTPYLQHPSERTVLVIEVERVFAGWPPVPRIEPAGQVDLIRWLRRKAANEGYEVEPGALEALVETVGDDLLMLESEIEKQFLHCYESRVISLKSVRDVTLDGRQYGLFALTDAIAKRQTKEALEILGKLYQGGMTAPLVLSALYSNFRRLLVAREMLSRQKPFAEVLRVTNIWSYKGRERDVRSYDEKDLRHIVLQLHASDRTCKTTGTDEKTHLERVVVDTCRRTSVK
ncbi:MAG TPA: DNA polymerase III subunit delta [Acidobacteriota bacterium]|nr:DNA polymerase III subunit delta [Acidobacteriota bacterium]